MTPAFATMLKGSTNLQQQIRTGCSPDDPELLQHYINLALDSADAAEASSEKIRILLETACDHQVALNWRHLCLDQIYRPLLRAEKTSTTASDHYRVRQFSLQFRLLTPTFF